MITTVGTLFIDGCAAGSWISMDIIEFDIVFVLFNLDLCRSLVVNDDLCGVIAFPALCQVTGVGELEDGCAIWAEEGAGVGCDAP